MPPCRDTNYYGRMVKKYLRAAIKCAVLTFFCCNREAVAASAKQCATRVAQCVNESTFSRGACYQKIARGALCQASPLRPIVLKRVRYSPQERRIEKRTRSMKGNTRVERMCLDNFDIQLRSAIDYGAITSERREALLAQLHRCAIKPPRTALVGLPGGTTP